MIYRKLVAGVGAAAALATGCGGASGEDPPEPRVTRSAARALPAVPGPLKPGTYKTTKFKPSFSFAVPVGWQLLSPEEPNLLTLRRVDDPFAVLAFVRVVRVFEPARRLTSKEIPADALLPAPRDLARWLHDHPRFETTAPVEVELDGVEATQVEGGVAPGKAYRSPYDRGRTVLTFLPRPGMYLATNAAVRGRGIAVPAKAPGFIIGAFALKEDFDTEIRHHERVLGSLRFGR